MTQETKTQHTAGPWSIAEPMPNWSHRDIRQNTGLLVATAQGAWTAEEVESNARLIAAAPDLLHAAQLMADHFADRVDVPADFEPYRQSLLAAIAKATDSQ